MTEKKLTKRTFKTRQLTVVGMLFAVTIVLGATGLGFIPIPPLKLTIMHIPVIIGSILEGPVIGGILGLFFGISSIIQNINTPTPVSFIFINPIVAVLPRIFIGITPWLTYKYLKSKKEKLKLILSAAAGAFTNTFGVIGLIYLLYLNAYANALHISIIAAKYTLLAYLLDALTSSATAIAISVPIIIAVRKSRKN